MNVNCHRIEEGKVECKACNAVVNLRTQMYGNKIKCTYCGRDYKLKRKQLKTIINMAAAR